jgi:hypothetical protein
VENGRRKMTEDVDIEGIKKILSKTLLGNFLTTEFVCHKNSSVNFKMPNPDYDEIEFIFSILVEMQYEKGDKNIFVFKTSEFVDRWALTSHSYLCVIAKHIEEKLLKIINKNINSEVKSVTFSKVCGGNNDNK